MPCSLMSFIDIDSNFIVPRIRNLKYLMGWRMILITVRIALKVFVKIFLEPFLVFVVLVGARPR